MSVNLIYDYKKKLCDDITKQITKMCCTVNREKCADLLDKYKKFCTSHK